MEDRFDLHLQPPRHHCLGNSVAHGGNPKNSGSRTVWFRYLHCAHRRRKVTPRGHPVPDPIQIVLQVLLKILDRAAVHTWRPLVLLDPFPCIPYFPLRNIERLD
jgi:hypothetical protein